MKNVFIRAALVVGVLSITTQSFAGNKDRTGQAGATELLINPWAQSTGVFGMNVSYVSGVEAMKTNIAGLAGVEKTDVGVSHVIYLTNSQVTVNNLAIAQKLGTIGVIGLNIMSMGFGDIQITTVDNPEGTGTFKPQFLNFELGFAKEFSNNVRAGLAATFVSEQLTSIHATGACFEAGVQYVTGKRDNFHFGITLRNVGTNMRFTGPGFSINAQAPKGNYSLTQETPTDKFQMPTYLSIGSSYDFYLDENHLKSVDDKPKHRLTVLVDFTSNSFNNDYLGGGLEYSFREMLMLRAAYRYENGIGTTTSTTMYTGLAAGVTIQKRITENGPILGLDYSFRPTAKPNNGVHVISLRLVRK
ncbi:MAG: PorV/PorQ family protein [Taibaiella sp.]|nr:PorV/PorQ family protein [Taibaiella sp.]